MQLKRVVITGLGALTPVGNSAPETWEALVAGKSGIAPITAFDATHFKTQFAGEVKNFDPTPVIDRKEARKMDRFCQNSSGKLLVLATRAAPSRDSQGRIIPRIPIKARILFSQVFSTSFTLLSLIKTLCTKCMK